MNPQLDYLYEDDEPTEMQLKRERLFEKVKGMRNQDQWKITKNSRINIDKLQGQLHRNFPPIVSTILECSKDNSQTIHDFVLPSKPKQESSKRLFPFISMGNRRKNETEPSFVSYKQNQNEKVKIYKMIDKPTIKNQIKTRIRTQQNSIRQQIKKSHKIKYPTELKELKQKLRVITSPTKNQNTPIGSSNVSLNNIRQTFNSRSENQYFDRSRLKNSYVQCTVNNKEDCQNYLSQIIRKSNIELNLESDSQISLKCSQLTDQSRIKKPRLLTQSPSKRYWPDYAEYSSANQQTHYSEMKQQLNKSIEKNTNYDEDATILEHLIKNQFKNQQKVLNREVVNSEKNSLEGKYRFKLELEKESYQRNIKDYIRCKQAHRLEKIKFQIKANGINKIRNDKVIESNRKNRQMAQQAYNQQQQQ